MVAATSVLRYTAFGLMAVFAALGTVFIAGEAMTDPGGAAGVLLCAAWVIPMVLLALYALWRPGPAARVLMVVSVTVVAFFVVDAAYRLTPRMGVGPVGTIAAFAAVVALGFLGLHRPAPAGWLMVLVGVAALGGGGSSLAVAIPAILVGGLYLVANDGRAPTGRGTARTSGSTRSSR